MAVLIRIAFGATLIVPISNPSVKSLRSESSKVRGNINGFEFFLGVCGIFNDGRFTNVQRQQKEWFDGRVICSDLHNPDFVKLAESFGAAGFKAHDPESLRTAIRAAFEEVGPSIIEVEVDEFFPPPWPFLMLPQNRKAVCE